MKRITKSRKTTLKKIPVAFQVVVIGSADLERRAPRTPVITTDKTRLGTQKPLYERQRLQMMTNPSPPSGATGGTGSGAGVREGREVRGQSPPGAGGGRKGGRERGQQPHHACSTDRNESEAIKSVLGRS